MPWWTWPSVLALDAPIVGVAWLYAVAWHTGTPVTIGAAAVITMSIWLAYTGDRLIDARRLAANTVPGFRASGASHRHVYAARHTRVLTFVWLLVFALDVGIAVRVFPADSLAFGLGIMGLSAIALGARLRSTLVGVLTRSGLVGAAFAGAVAIALDPASVGRAAPVLIAFASVCTANVVAVGRWERDVLDGVEAPDVPSAVSLSLSAAVFAGCLALAVMARDPLALCAATSAGLLVVLQIGADRGPADALRLCADAALVLPLLALW